MALYLNVSQPMGGALNWSEGERLDEMDGIFAEMIRQINFIVSNLGADNVIEAASVKAENIDTKNAKIVNAQIKNLTASKIKAGTLDLSKKITIQNGNNTRSMTITEDGIRITDQTGQEDILRFALLPDENGKFVFMLCNEEGEPTIAMDDDGNAAFRGTVESSEIYSSHIVGTGKDTYGDYTPPEKVVPGVFVDIDKQGLKVMQDSTDVTGVKKRLQKIGMTTDSAGSAVLLLGAGDGDEANHYNINGVDYYNDMFMIAKGSETVTLTLRGKESTISMRPGYLDFISDTITHQSGDLHLNASNSAFVKCDYLHFNIQKGFDNCDENNEKNTNKDCCVASESYVDDAVNTAVGNLEKKIQALENRINSMGA